MRNFHEDPPDNMQFAVGRIVIGTLIFTSASITVASAVKDKRASGTMRYAIEAAFSSSGKRFVSRFEVDEGESIEVHSDHAGMLLVSKFQVHRTFSAKTVQIKARVNSGRLTVAQSTLLSTLGQASGIVLDTEQGQVELNLSVIEMLGVGLNKVGHQLADCYSTTRS